MALPYWLLPCFKIFVKRNSQPLKSFWRRFYRRSRPNPLVCWRCSWLRHLCYLFLILAAVTEPVGSLLPVLNLGVEESKVAWLILPPHLPLAGVVVGLDLVHHCDAVLHGANRLTHATPAASFHVGVVQALGGNVKTGIGALQPAQRALDAGVEVEDRPHRSCGELLERGIARRLEAADRLILRVRHGMALRDTRDRNSIAHFVPLRHFELVRDFGIPLAGLNSHR